ELEHSGGCSNSQFQVVSGKGGKGDGGCAGDCTISHATNGQAVNTISNRYSAANCATRVYDVAVASDADGILEHKVVDCVGRTLEDYIPWDDDTTFEGDVAWHSDGGDIVRLCYQAA